MISILIVLQLVTKAQITAVCCRASSILGEPEIRLTAASSMTHALGPITHETGGTNGSNGAHGDAVEFAVVRIEKFISRNRTNSLCRSNLAAHASYHIGDSWPKLRFTMGEPDQLRFGESRLRCGLSPSRWPNDLIASDCRLPASSGLQHARKRAKVRHNCRTRKSVGGGLVETRPAQERR
ncbi:hypothetical protein F4777DRAFT_72355 [Nemania sp. FL0916]|nr:hypothetical protein F4777DRAFT_72355 [Nemania sp. FL0916]